MNLTATSPNVPFAPVAPRGPVAPRSKAIVLALRSPALSEPLRTSAPRSDPFLMSVPLSEPFLTFLPVMATAA